MAGRLLKLQCLQKLEIVLQVSLKPPHTVLDHLLLQNFGTPLHRATYWGSLDVAQLLIQRGADVNAMSKARMSV